MAFPDGTADFRSDTVTQPTAQMRAAMFEAVVGDDAYGEDPTVNRLEEESAAAVGKEAALFVPSGTMANQLALWALTDRGDDVLCSSRAHIRNAEMGAGAALSGVGFRPAGDDFGSISRSDLQAALAEAGTYLPPVGLVAFENTHYFSGGTVLPAELVADTAQAAHDSGVAVYLDGARLWNAVVASGVEGALHAGPADAVSFCFSKGLGAPVGSALCGSSDLIAQARPQRKRLGGGMRQAGVLAAAARLALQDRERLADDHSVARRLGEAIAERFEGSVDPKTLTTNMVMVAEDRLPFHPGALVRALAAEGIKVGYVATGILRFATHRDVDDADVDRVLAVVDAMEAAG